MMFWTDGDMLETFSKRWVAKIDLSLQDFSTKLVDFDDSKLFIRIFLYCRLYQGELKVITHPQCGLHFFIAPLTFPVAAFTGKVKLRRDAKTS